MIMFNNMLYLLELLDLFIFLNVTIDHFTTIYCMHKSSETAANVEFN